MLLLQINYPYVRRVFFCKILQLYRSHGGFFHKFLRNKLSSKSDYSNLIFSHYESYTSFGVATDLSFMFYDEKRNLTAVLTAKNAGYQLKGFTKNNNEPLPLEILAPLEPKFPF